MCKQCKLGNHSADLLNFKCRMWDGNNFKLKEEKKITKFNLIIFTKMIK
jgi:hypothetical protein